jgi:hypothetical protein
VDVLFYLPLNRYAYIYDFRHGLLDSFLFLSFTAGTSVHKAVRTKAKMSLHFPAITGLAALSSFALVTYLPDILLSSRPSYAGTFAQLWALGLSLNLSWAIILYPKFFSPLRHLPGPKAGSWWNGSFLDITRRPTGEPMKEW